MSKIRSSFQDLREEDISCRAKKAAIQEDTAQHMHQREDSLQRKLCLRQCLPRSLTATALPSSSQLIGSYPPLLLLPPYPMSSSSSSSSSSISREDVVMKQSAKDEENPDSRPQVAKE